MSEGGKKRNRDKPRSRLSPTENTLLVTGGGGVGAGNRVGRKDGTCRDEHRVQMDVRITMPHT